MGTIGDGTGSGYPGTIDSTENRNDGDIITANFQNDIQAVAQRYQTVLGLNPQGADPSVVARLDRMEGSSFIDASERNYTPAVGVPQTLQADTIAAGLMSPTRVLHFEYGGKYDRDAGGDLEARLLYGTTVIATFSMAGGPTDIHFNAKGTITMRDASRSQAFWWFAQGNSGGSDFYNRSVIAEDFSQAFTLNFVVEQTVAGTVAFQLWSSVVQISG